MNLKLSRKIRVKLEERSISEEDLKECFMNRDGKFLTDTREQHQTDPITQWFIAETDKQRLLKVMFMKFENHIQIKSAYEPEPDAIWIYNTKAK